MEILLHHKDDIKMDEVQIEEFVKKRITEGLVNRFIPLDPKLKKDDWLWSLTKKKKLYESIHKELQKHFIMQTGVWE